MIPHMHFLSPKTEIRGNLITSARPRDKKKKVSSWLSRVSIGYINTGSHMKVACFPFKHSILTIFVGVVNVWSGKVTSWGTVVVGNRIADLAIVFLLFLRCCLCSTATLKYLWLFTERVLNNKQDVIYKGYTMIFDFQNLYDSMHTVIFFLHTPMIYILKAIICTPCSFQDYICFVSFEWFVGCMWPEFRYIMWHTHTQTAVKPQTCGPPIIIKPVPDHGPPIRPYSTHKSDCGLSLNLNVVNLHNLNVAHPNCGQSPTPYCSSLTNLLVVLHCNLTAVHQQTWWQSHTGAHP